MVLLLTIRQASLLQEQPADRPDIHKILLQCSTKANINHSGSSHSDQALTLTKTTAVSSSGQRQPAANGVSDAMIKTRKDREVSQRQIPFSTPFANLAPPFDKHSSSLRSSSTGSPRLKAEDELSTRYPAIDIIPSPQSQQLRSPPIIRSKKSILNPDLSEKVSNRLTDKIFAQPLSASTSQERTHRAPSSQMPVRRPQDDMSQTSSLAIAGGPSSAPANALIDPTAVTSQQQPTSQPRLATLWSTNSHTRSRSNDNPHRINPVLDSSVAPQSKHSTRRSHHRSSSVGSNSTEFIQTSTDDGSQLPDRILRRRSGPQIDRRMSARYSGPGRPSHRNILKGRFNDAFRLFESNRGSTRDTTPELVTTFVPSQEQDNSDNRTADPTPQRTTLMSTGDQLYEPSSSAEARRDAERQQLMDEEVRVDVARRDYQRHLENRNVKSADGDNRAKGSQAASIQQRVLSIVSSVKEDDRIGRVASLPLDMPSDNASTGKCSSRGLRPPPPKKPPNLKARPKSFDASAHLAAFESPAGDAVPWRSTGVSTPSQSEDWEADFSRRFPSLGHIELVETKIELPI